jgi:pimeloyl-ACP methyl ester carboxylesterase
MAEVVISGRKLSYEAHPAAFDKSQPALVFIAGTGGDREDWRGQLDGLTDRVVRIALELPGHGKSDPPGETSVPVYANWVADFVDSLGLEKVILVGCSLGSAIVQWLALAGMSWLKGIVLVGSGARLKVHPAFLAGLQEDKDKAVEMLVDFCLSPATGESLRDKIRSKYLQTPASLLHGDLSACNEFDVMGRLNEITVPTCIIVGEDDRLTPVKYSQFLQKAIVGARMGVVPEAGHLVMMEKIDQFNGILERFLTDTPVLELP